MMDSGSIRTPPSSIVNGGAATAQSTFSQVLEALQAIYNPSSTNDTRRQASEYLEQAKAFPGAPSYGFRLALDTSQPAQLRHYGLSVLEHAMNYGWEDVSEEEVETLMGYIVQLAQNVNQADPPFLRNKVAQLWSEIAKRAWGAEWTNMDEQLVGLWSTSPHHQLIVLNVLETLSEEIFNREDPTAGLRGSVLGRAFVEIFTPAAVLAEQLPHRDPHQPLRFGEEGWLTRLRDMLGWCLDNKVDQDEWVQKCAIKTLNTLRTTMSFVIPKAVAAVNLVEKICRTIAVPVVPLQQASVEVLHALYSRYNTLLDEDFVELVCPMYTPDRVNLLSEAYDWSVAGVDATDIDDQKYTLCKKLSELATDLGNYIALKPSQVPEGSDIPSLFRVLFKMAQNPSLVVSIPALHCWTKLLRSKTVRESNMVSPLMGGLLGTCCARLVRYESFPEDSQDWTILFLNEDLDTIPERHAFLGNYRRFCADVVESLTRQAPVEAMSFLLGQAGTLFENLYSNEPPFNPQTFSKHSAAALRVDAQATVLDAALKGYLRWLSTQGGDPADMEQARNSMEDSFEQWCGQLLRAKFEDPEILKKVVQLVSTFATKALSKRPNFALTFLEYLLNVKPREDPSFPHYTEAVKDLERTSSLEMQKLAILFANDLMAVYPSLEAKVNALTSSNAVDGRQRMAFSAFLFIIVHRTTSLDGATQEARLRQMIAGVTDLWRNEAFTRSLSDFGSFCALLGLDRLPQFLSSHHFHQVADWAAQPLDDEGRAMQADITQRSQQLPIRLTKTLLAASIEKLREQSAAYDLALKLWSEALPDILPMILRLVNFAQAFNNIEQSWSGVPVELAQVIRRVLTDRFWQAGISTESKDDFFARVNGSKSTYEGFASTVRGTVRQIRESSYYILYSLTRFQNAFYGITDLPQPLSEALFGNARALSPHHLSVLLGVSTHIIESCPAEHRPHFLPPVVSSLFRELEGKITSEWDVLNRKIAECAPDDDLTDEMKTESILRQLTFSSVSLVSQLFDYRRGGAQVDPHHPPADSGDSKEPMWEFLLSNETITVQILLFLKTVIRVRDTRSVVIAVRVLRWIIPNFEKPSQVREFFCTDILKSAITSLHEPAFVDAQKDLAGLIAAIIHLDDHLPKQILLQLPGMDDEDRINKRLARLKACKSARDSDRTQRSIVLDLLSTIRGVSIHEQGKIERARPKPKRKPQVQEQYMAVEQPATIVRGTSPGLEGVSDMFGQS